MKAFSVGERVQISAPGWAWDGKVGEVKAVAAEGKREPDYIVWVDYPDGKPRRYILWHSQLQPAPPAPSESEAT